MIACMRDRGFNYDANVYVNGVRGAYVVMLFKATKKTYFDE